MKLGPTEVMVTLLARDAEWFIRPFLEHHFALGAAHVLVIDNGSTDDTVKICSGYDRVTVLQNLLPANVHESGFRSNFSQRIASGGWIMFADADEMIELPLAGPDALSGLTDYCNERGYTAVLGQMLDRFSTAHYDELKTLSYDKARQALNCYSLREMKKIAYHDRDAVEFAWHLRENISENNGVNFHRGGVRQELFAESPFLSKHTLVRNLPGVVPMVHPHCASGVRVADVTLLIHHYKLAGDWMARDVASVRAGTWVHGEDAKRLAAIKRAGHARLVPAEPMEWRGIKALEDEGFLYVSPTFRERQR